MSLTHTQRRDQCPKQETNRGPVLDANLAPSKTTTRAAKNEAEKQQQDKMQTLNYESHRRVKTTACITTSMHAPHQHRLATRAD